MKPREADMTDELLGRFQVFKALTQQAGHIYGVNWSLTAVLRTTAEQMAYHAQGRNPLAVVNEYRRKAGMLPISERENKYCVTWTQNSKHFADDTGKSRAFDFVILKPGRVATWDIKFDNDNDDIGDYLELAQIAKAAGLEAGAYWAKPDMPHVQLPATI